MSYAERHVVTMVTATGGGATGYTPVITGAISSIAYVKTDYATGVDFTITAEATGDTVWTESNVDSTKTVAPRQATHSTFGVAALYAAGGVAVLAPIQVAQDRIKIVVAAGGNTKTGTFHVTVGG